MIKPAKQLRVNSKQTRYNKGIDHDITYDIAHNKTYMFLEILEGMENESKQGHYSLDLYGERIEIAMQHEEFFKLMGYTFEHDSISERCGSDYDDRRYVPRLRIVWYNEGKL